FLTIFDSGSSQIVICHYPELSLLFNIPLVLNDLVLCRMAVEGWKHHCRMSAAFLDVVDKFDHVFRAFSGSPYNDADTVLYIWNDLFYICHMFFIGNTLIFTCCSKDADSLHALFDQPVQIFLC